MRDLHCTTTYHDVAVKFINEEEELIADVVEYPIYDHLAGRDRFGKLQTIDGFLGYCCQIKLKRPIEIFEEFKTVKLLNREIEVYCGNESLLIETQLHKTSLKGDC